ncbi:MAG TPA: hypothetical protein VGI75_01570, partial [Pirellulales bacterium]
MRLLIGRSLVATLLTSVGLLFTFSAGAVFAQPGPPPMPQDDAGGNASSNGSGPNNGAEALLQGPVHEAFAKPLEMNPEPGPIIKKKPPDAIAEIPPAEKPDGDNIVWIPGYWSWDDDRESYLWVSGVYRAAPPYQTWVPGYWEEVESGFQWTPGFWTAAAKNDVDYVPTPPPESLENGPSSPQPSENQFWVPGTWVYQNVNVAQPYVWRTGYWTACQNDWIFIPPHWVWTPGGFVFVDGYWDYTLARRGCLFAPMYYSSPLYLTAGYSFTPSVLINVGLFNDCLFARPRYCSYYFGDYFGPRYVGLGFRPWCSAGLSVNFGFDPLFTYYRWNNMRRNPNWLTDTRRHFELAERNDALRPPKTFLAQQQLLKSGGGNRGGNNLVLATTLKQAATNPGDNGFKFHTISQSDRLKLADNGRQLQQASVQRLDFEKRNFDQQKNGGAGKVGGKFDGGPALGGNAANGAGEANKNDGSKIGSGTNQNLGKWKLPTAAASNLKAAAGDTAGNNSGGQGTNVGGDNGSKSRFDRFSQNPGGGNSLNGGGNSGTNNSSGGNSGGSANASGNRGIGRGNNVLNGSGQTFGGRSGSTGIGNILQGGNGQAGSGAGGGNDASSGISGRGQSGQQRFNNSNQSGASSGGNNLGTINPGAGSGNNRGLGNGASGFNGSSGNFPTRSLNNGSTGILNPGVGGGAGIGTGGGGGGRSGGAGGGGGGGGNQQKNNKNDQNKQSSNFEPPSTNFNLGTSDQAPIDVKNALKANRDALRAPKTGIDEYNRQFKSIQSPKLGLSSVNDLDEEGVPTPNPLAAGGRSAGSTRIGPTTGITGNGQPTSGGNSGAGTSGRFGSSFKQNDANAAQGGAGAPSPTNPSPIAEDSRSNNSLPKPGSNDFERPNPGDLRAISPLPQAPVSPYLARYDYQTLMDRGRTLSPNAANSSQQFTAPGDNTMTTQRPKDPMVSYGSPTSKSRSAYGPGPTGPSGLAGNSGYGSSSGGSSPMTAGPYTGRGVSGMNGAQLSGMNAPAQSGISQQFTSGMSAPMKSGMSGTMSSGMSAPMASGTSAPMTSGLSGLTNPSSQFGAGSYISPGGGGTLPTAGSLTGSGSGNG